jgi:predicted amidohydrolase YtcJ
MDWQTRQAAALSGRLSFAGGPPLLLTNFRLRSTDAAEAARAVLLRDGVVAGIGDARSLPAAGVMRHDCRGALLLPAFVDAHCHILATAAALRSVDCSSATSIADIQQMLREASVKAPRNGGWLRAVGYDETRLAERRHPDRRDLDAAVADMPVRLLHRSGHAVVLNTRAMQLAGITIDTPEPSGGRIERDLESGDPTGLLFEMNEVVDRAVPPLSYDELAAAVEKVARRYLAQGVAAVCDATHTNGPAEWRLFERLQADGHLPLDVTLMEGYGRMGQAPAEPGPRLRRGHVKVMLTEIGDRLSPSTGELREIVADVHAAGRDVAIHAVEEHAVAAAIDAIESAVSAVPRAHLHRIEHAALVPPGAPERMARAGITAVMHPSWVWHHGDRYLREVPPARHDALHPLGDMVRAGVSVAAGTDAPVAHVDIMSGLRAAAERRTAAGQTLGSGQAVDDGAAVSMWTSEAAAASLMPQRGRLNARAPADVVLLLRSGGAYEVAATLLRGTLVAGGLP